MSIMLTSAQMGESNNRWSSRGLNQYLIDVSVGQADMQSNSGVSEFSD